MVQLLLQWVNRKTTIFMPKDLSTSAVPNQSLFTLPTLNSSFYGKVSQTNVDMPRVSGPTGFFL